MWLAASLRNRPPWNRCGLSQGPGSMTGEPRPSPDAGLFSAKRIDRNSRELPWRASKGWPKTEMPTVLIIDDNDLVRTMLQAQFEAAGFSVGVAIDGEDGIGKFKQQPFDLVISDIFMPREGGTFVVRNIRSLAPQVPIIVMTAAELTSEEIGSVLGAVRTIFKPFRPRQLIALARECLA